MTLTLALWCPRRLLFSKDRTGENLRLWCQMDSRTLSSQNLWWSQVQPGLVMNKQLPTTFFFCGINSKTASSQTSNAFTTSVGVHFHFCPPRQEEMRSFRCLSYSAAPPGLAALILLTHRRNVLTSRAASPYTSSKSSWNQVGLLATTTKYRVTVRCFNGTTIYAILESTAMLSFNKQIVATNNHYGNVQGLQWCNVIHIQRHVRR